MPIYTYCGVTYASFAETDWTKEEAPRAKQGFRWAKVSNPKIKDYGPTNPGLRTARASKPADQAGAKPKAAAASPTQPGQQAHAAQKPPAGAKKPAAPKPDREAAKTAAVSAANDMIGKIKGGDRSPEAAQALTDHLAKLTLPQLKQIRDQHGLKCPAKLKAEVVAHMSQVIGASGTQSSTPPPTAPAPVSAPQETQAPPVTRPAPTPQAAAPPPIPAPSVAQSTQPAGLRARFASLVGKLTGGSKPVVEDDPNSDLGHELARSAHPSQTKPKAPESEFTLDDDGVHEEPEESPDDFIKKHDAWLAARPEKKAASKPALAQKPAVAPQKPSAAPSTPNPAPAAAPKPALEKATDNTFGVQWGGPTADEAKARAERLKPKPAAPPVAKPSAATPKPATPVAPPAPKPAPQATPAAAAPPAPRKPAEKPPQAATTPRPIAKPVATPKIAPKAATPAATEPASDPVADISKHLNDLYSATGTGKGDLGYGFGDVEHAMGRLESLSPAQVRKVATNFQLKLPSGASKSKTVAEVRRKLEDLIGTADRVTAISDAPEEHAQLEKRQGPAFFKPAATPVRPTPIAAKQATPVPQASGAAKPSVNASPKVDPNEVSDTFDPDAPAETRPDSELPRSITDGIKDLDSAGATGDGMVKIDQLYEQAKQNHPGLTPAQFHAALQSMWDRKEINMHAANDPKEIKPGLAYKSPRSEDSLGYVTLGKKNAPQQMSPIAGKQADADRAAQKPAPAAGKPKTADEHHSHIGQLYDNAGQWKPGAKTDKYGAHSIEDSVVSGQEIDDAFNDPSLAKLPMSELHKIAKKVNAFYPRTSKPELLKKMRQSVHMRYGMKMRSEV